jgi:hypothetical protein
VIGTAFASCTPEVWPPTRPAPEKRKISARTSVEPSRRRRGTFPEWSGPIPSMGRERDRLNVRNWRKYSVERLVKLSWRGRGTGGTCTAEVDHPIRGYRVNQRNRSNPFATSGPDGSTPTVTWISYDGDTYWVRLSAAQGWPRTIRVTQSDVDGARLLKSHADDSD